MDQSFGEKLKKWFGVERKSEYVKNYLQETNIRSAIYMSVIVIVLEIWMLQRQTKRLVDSGDPLTLQSFLYGNRNFLILLITGIIMLVFAVAYVRGYKKKRPFSIAVISIFGAVCLSFGFYVSYYDYADGKQIMAFLTMALFVGCILVWNPILSFVMLTLIFHGFYQIMERVAAAGGFQVRSGDQVNYITFWISVTTVSISLYHQRVAEAIKDENLERVNRHLHYMAVTDETTRISNIQNFMNLCREKMQDPAIDVTQWVYLFMNVENFGNYNEKYGYEAGNQILVNVAKILKDSFEDGIVARQADDHFVVFTAAENLQKLESVRSRVRGLENDVRIGMNTGSYRPTSREVDPNIACDHARTACATVRKRHDVNYREYDAVLEKQSHRKKYIINHLDQAIEKRYIRPYYQPVVFAKTRKLCGFEALARWIDPEEGFLSPGDFIPALEEYHEIYKLDRCIIESVCRDIRETLDKGLPVVPISLNFSRLDFEVPDAIDHLNRTVDRYQVPRDLIHVEITESTLSENTEKLQASCAELHKLGYALWLDDFGSGYSALNVLKDYEFDALKIDMTFLSNFSGNPKSRPLLKSVVGLADALGISTLAEGVETEEEADFLEEIGCERLQGYLYGKPMPKDGAIDIIIAGKVPVSEEYQTRN